VASHHTATATRSPQSHQTHSAKSPSPSIGIGKNNPSSSALTQRRRHCHSFTYPPSAFISAQHRHFTIPSPIHFDSQYPDFSQYFSSLILIACGQLIFSPGEMTSTAALYTTETCIQHIQGSHKTTPFADWPTHSANTRSFRRSYIVARCSSIDFADCQPRTSRPTDRYPLSKLIPFLSIRYQPTSK
jgi:hypothetical protein